MQFNFDEEIDKTGLHNTKWEFRPEIGKQQAGINIYGDHAHPKHGKDRLVPMWVADMDFRSPPAVIEAVVAWAKRGVYGYSSPADSFYEVVIEWVKRRYGRDIQRDWITITPGVNAAIHMMIQTFVQPGEKVLVQRPVYYPFFDAVQKNGAELVSNSLVLENGRYHIDFDDLAQKAADPAVKAIILSSPHNPVGRVWERDELARLGDICLANDVLVIADEVHCDLIFPGVPFTSFANISEEFERRSIVCLSASKSFNLAGFKTSTIIIPDEAMRTQFQMTAFRNGLRGVNGIGMVATEAAYRHGEAWLTAVVDYIEGNVRFLTDYLEAHIPQLQLIPPEGTYLGWVDCHGLGLALEARKLFLLEQAKLILDEGELFGPEGAGFERFNLACPRPLLQEALEKLGTAVANL